MSTIQVQVRHAGKKYDVEVDLEEPGAVFKSQLYSLTGVPPDRQKILVKGGQLKDETDMKALGLKPNQSLMMLGTAGELPKAPVTPQQFIEDMTASQIAEKKPSPSGLVNTGNTCYMNSTLQALRVVPELQDSLKSYRGTSGFGSYDLTTSLKDLYGSMSRSNDPFTPHMFLHVFRQRFPQFQETDQSGFPKQQDAEEAWSQILSELRQTLKASGEENVGSVIEKYFGGEFQTTLKTDETDAEEPKVGVEPFLKLNCHIGMGTNFVRDGLLEGLTETLEKHSDVLDRNAQYTLKKEITRLPKYLTVHYVRFFWRRDTSKKSKILRKVAFPFYYDATELCSADLQKKLIPGREKYRELEKDKQELQRAAKRAKMQSLDGELSKDVNKEGKLSDSKKADLQAKLSEALDPSLRADNGCNPIGLYELSAVITHQGANADSGHYQCFVKNDDEEGTWWRFNDDKVTIVDETRIEGLAGGGESDSALILLYRTAGF
ncbi:ubiquitin carboxyl-terminal hydrolase 6 [Trichomonascus vanleenenianus]|uniref:ubiquitin-specific protease UBP6 n=1 Tax=Trichomonascus vanleenenianus TaxID=2268995 RepID=UPI003EC97716